MTAIHGTALKRRVCARWKDFGLLNRASQIVRCSNVFVKTVSGVTIKRTTNGLMLIVK